MEVSKLHGDVDTSRCFDLDDLSRCSYTYF